MRLIFSQSPVFPPLPYFIIHISHQSSPCLEQVLSMMSKLLFMMNRKKKKKLRIYLNKKSDVKNVEPESHLSLTCQNTFS